MEKISVDFKCGEEYVISYYDEFYDLEESDEIF